ncbi:SOS response-associated peptidase family protein [Formosa sp. PL04]|uniref:SOS response-associated peptidase family protein n=1 Tax=Formosa sp. PL04 TaxID=3081755 RepID=UPI002982B6A7|nr:SOS response-associated peptidase family protein [Formosa sp. PL04]MDW5290411.1 SOS response-associated peptidase family protein [Formosa sp. PL04]
MFYKLSNIANRASVENSLCAKFKFPHIYKPKKIIDGTTESVLPILTSENKNQIQFAIWGMLPEYFKGDWKPYQNVQNTLNIKTGTLKKHLEFYRNSQVKRCLIPITGYIDFDNIKGEITPYLISHTKATPFCVAGIYNQLEDGFLTFSIIVNEDLDTTSTSVSSNQPAILHCNYHQDWLNPEIDTLRALDYLQQPHDYTVSRFPTSTHLLLNSYSENHNEDLGLEDAV